MYDVPSHLQGWVSQRFAWRRPLLPETALRVIDCNNVNFKSQLSNIKILEDAADSTCIVLYTAKLRYKEFYRPAQLGRKNLENQEKNKGKN